jgi:hypothetical protein
MPGDWFRLPASGSSADHGCQHTCPRRPHGAIQWAGVGDAAAVQVVISGSGALLGLKMAEE